MKPENEKYTHAEVGYEHPARGEDHCGLCKHFLGTSCEIVRRPIRKRDWCEEFKAKDGEKNESY